MYPTLVSAHLTCEVVANVVDGCQARLVFSDARLLGIVDKLVESCPRVGGFLRCALHPPPGIRPTIVRCDP